MTEPDWARVLGVMYDDGMAGGSLDVETTGGIMPGPKVMDEETNEFLKAHAEWELEQIDQFSEELGIGTEDVRNLLDDMRLLNLIEEVPVAIDNKPVSLTEKGFDVAHERETNERQNQTNLILAALTAGLFFTATVQAIGAYYTVPTPERVSMGIGTAVIGVLVIVILIAMFHR